MKKLACFSVSIILAITASFAVSCSQNNSSGLSESVAQGVFTIRYFDDAATPVEVGHAYVANGRKALFVNDTAYDYQTRKDVTNPAIVAYGSYLAFDHWAFQNGSSAEQFLAAVDKDADVYPAFAPEAYTLRLRYQNGADLLRDEDGNLRQSLVRYGDKLSLPDVVPVGDPLYGHRATFDGFVFPADAAALPFTQADLLASSFLSGQGAPSANAAKGSVYCDLSVASGKLSYDFYGSNGTAWFLLGKLSENPTVVLKAHYADGLAAFAASFYSDQAQSSLLGSADILYESALTCTIAGTTTSFAYTDAAGAQKTLALTTEKTPVRWAGAYLSTADVPSQYQGQSVSFDHVMAKAAYYPLYA